MNGREKCFIKMQTWMMLCVCALLLSVAHVRKVEAANDGVQKAINNVLAKYPDGSYFSSTGKACGPGQTNYGYGNYCTYCQLWVMDSEASKVCGNGDSCNAFAKYVFYKVFGLNPRSCSSTSCTNLNGTAQIGDFVTCYSGGNAVHYLIYMGSAGGNEFYAYEANVGTENLVKYKFLHCSRYNNLWSSYTVFHASNYDQVNGPSHTHSYSSTVTKQPTCTQTGVRTYRCSCGASYTEVIAATGHKYVNTVVNPTLTEKGYTIHTCSVCKNSYKDTYVDPPKANSDGWYYCSSMPSGVSSDKYTIEYNNHYEKVQASSPGADWKNVGTVKDEWQNSGAQYDSEQDLPTSNERVLVNSVYYHFCGPNAGTEGNYEQTSKFVHYDGVPAGSVTESSTGMDGSHRYYLLNWNNGNGTVYCQSGVTCDGAYGSHGKRCKAWYKMNTYQNRVHVVQYKFAKDSGWSSKKDTTATSTSIRFKEIEPEQKLYKVVFMDGEQIIKTENVLEGEAAVAPTDLTKEGYVLSWDKSFDKIEKDLVVNAIWTAKQDNTQKEDEKKEDEKKPDDNKESKNDQKPTEDNNQGSSEQPSIDNNKQQNTDKQPNTEQQSTADKKQENKNTSSYQEKKQDQVKGLKVKAKGSGKLYIKWQWVLTADKYKVLVSTNKNFKHAKKKYTYLRKITFKNLKKGKKYYVKVQAMTKKGKRKYKYGPWSDVKRVKVK